MYGYYCNQVFEEFNKMFLKKGSDFTDLYKELG
jgi:hypothetical protein